VLVFFARPLVIVALPPSLVWVLLMRVAKGPAYHRPV
jgi:hypothetical protein